MVVSPVEDGSVHDPVRSKRHDGADDSAGEDVVPVVRLVDAQRTRLENGAEERREEEGQPPERGAVVAPDLELGVHPEEEEDESGKGSCRMTRWKRGHGVLQGLLVRIRANVDRVHNLVEANTVEAGGIVCGCAGDVWLAHLEEVWSEATNELLDDDLEQGAENERVQHAHDAVVHVPEAADADLG